MNEPMAFETTRPNKAVSRANTMLILASVISLISGALLVLVVLLLPSLLSAAAGLFIFFGIPLGLLSVVLQMIGTGLLIGASQTSNDRFRIVTVASTILCWIATVLTALVVVVAFAMMSA